MHASPREEPESSKWREPALRQIHGAQSAARTSFRVTIKTWQQSTSTQMLARYLRH